MEIEPTPSTSKDQPEAEQDTSMENEPTPSTSNTQPEAEQEIPFARRPNADFVKLISADGREFYIETEVAYISKTLEAMASCPGEDEEITVHLKKIS